ncbi:MAG: prolipoprotein diacylglyceryl transferase [Candidatus Dadabacteria bacterium]|nr:MAG: prolipoprotein diacylglyceryl transferase [Candidatus Dadabacteria bacterium]
MFTWDVSPILIQLGPVTIRYYGLLFVFTILGGFHLWRWQMLRGGYDEELAERFFWWGVIAVLVGARVGHVWFYEWDRFVRDPIYIIYIWRGGLASHGATIGLIIALVGFAKKYKIHVLEVFDRFSFSAAWGSFMVRIGNFFNSEIVGRETDVPWCVYFPRSVYDRSLPLDKVPCRHPSQLYETAMGILVLLTLVAIDRKLKEDRPRGLLAAVFLVMYFTFRFFVEFVKAYQTLDPNRSPLTMGQYLSIPFILGGIGLLIWTLKNRPPTVGAAAAPRAKAARGTKRGKTKRKKH